MSTLQHTVSANIVVFPIVCTTCAKSSQGIIKVSSALYLVSSRHTGKALFLFPFNLGASVTFHMLNQATEQRSPLLYKDLSSIFLPHASRTPSVSRVVVRASVCSNKSPQPITWPALRPDGLKACVYTGAWSDTRGFFPADCRPTKACYLSQSALLG